MRLVTFLALLGLAVWFLWPQYLKWKQRRRFREEIYPRVRAFIRKGEAGFNRKVRAA